MIQKFKINKGDKGYVDANGFLHLTTGNGIGKIHKINNIKLNGYDIENISSMIFNCLRNNLPLDDFIEYEELNKEDFTQYIEYILYDIL